MATSKDIVLLVNGHNIADAVTGMTWSGETEELDATTLADSGYRDFVAGFKTGEVTISGIFDSDTVNDDEIHDILSDAYNTGVAKNLLASTGVVSIGSPAIMLDGSQMSYDIPHETGALIFVNGRFSANSGIKFGKWHMHALQAAGTNNGTGIDNGAATSNGGFLQVHLFNDDATDVDTKLQDSANGSVWADVTGAVVNNLSATHSSGSVSVTGTIRQHTRVVSVVTGGDTFLVSAAFARG